MDKALTQDATAACAAARAREQQIRRWRDLREHAASFVADLTAVPPFPLRNLLDMTDVLAERIGVEDPREIKRLTILIHNEAWCETVAGIPFSRRLLLLPQCLRSRDACPAGRDEFGLLCDACGRCVLGDLQSEASALGYAVLIAEGAEAAAGMLREGHLDAVIGVSCLPALEKTFLRIADEALPALAVPLLRDGCDATDVDVTTLLGHIRLIRNAEVSPRLSVSDVRASVQAWFAPDALCAVLGTESGRASEIALDWLAGSGKRWRPLLTASVYHALQDASTPVRPELIRVVAVAAECFHKASLIHDDIEDNDDFRYGVPTLHKEHGVPIALNVGDLLIGAGYRLLSTCPADESARLKMLTAAAMAHCGLCVGQGEELQWRGQAAVPSPAALIQMFSRKTAPAFEVAMLLGAIAGGADAATCAALSAFSGALGIAYQIGDDLQDIEQDGGARHAFGRQPSMMLSLLCDTCTEAERREIQTALQQAPHAEATRSCIRSLFARYGVVAAAEALRDDYRDRALQALTPIRTVMLKSVVTRLVKRILPAPASQREAAATNPHQAGGSPRPDDGGTGDSALRKTIAHGITDEA